MSYRFAVGAFAGALLLGLAAQAQAAAVVGAARIRVTNAIPTYLQVAEVRALEFGTGTNVAAAANGGTAAASSIYDSGYESGIAIDGFAGPNFFHSAGAGAGEYLDIVFGGARTLKSLAIHGRVGGCCTDRDLYNIEVFGADGKVLFSGQFDARNDRSLASVTFDDPPVAAGVPEPSVWALMILGFGAAGAAIRRRRLALA